MAYLCVDKSGEYIANECPTRGWDKWHEWRDVYGESCTLIRIPNKGEFNNAIYRKKNVQVMSYGVDAYHVMLARVMSKFGRYWEDNYRIVMVDKIKLIEE